MELNWYRSYPSKTDLATIPERRPRVVDALPIIELTRYDYKTVAELNSLQTDTGWPTEQPGFCMLEWDVALDPWQRKLFGAIALAEPRRVLVAPYRFWDAWSCWVNNDGSGPSENGRPIWEGEPVTDSFGLGCIYIPNSILHEFLVQMDKFGFSDGTFGKWYHEKYGKARATWEVHPQHLHEYEND